MTSSLNDLGIPESAGQFAHQRAGLIFFAGAPGSGRTTSAAALAGHITSTTGRDVKAVGKDAAAAVLQDEMEAGATAFLIDGPLGVDRLAAMVEAAVGGALIVATLSAANHPYAVLVDTIQAAEDWTGRLRRDFDATLYAIIQQKLSGDVLEAEVHFNSDSR